MPYLMPDAFALHRTLLAFACYIKRNPKLVRSITCFPYELCAEVGDGMKG
jgi:hypothetical protein